MIGKDSLFIAIAVTAEEGTTEAIVKGKKSNHLTLDIFKAPSNMFGYKEIQDGFTKLKNLLLPKSAP